MADTAAPVLVDGAWLAKRLQDPTVVIVDMTDEPQYRRYHIPGAVRLSYHELIKPRVRGRPVIRLNDDELAILLGELGIGRDTHVVAYDNMGGLNAGRLFFELERLQHPRVSVLDGGLVQWVLDARPVDNRSVNRKQVRYDPGSPRRPSLASIHDVHAASRDGSAVLLDVRTREEYAGDPKEARSGHVPGAHWWPWEQAFDVDNGFTMASREIEASLGKIGIEDRQAAVLLYCNSGHRASQTYLAMRHLGFQNVRLHVGSILEYLLDPRAPLNRGWLP